MAILRFRVYLEEDDSVYRDVAIRHKQHFKQFGADLLGTTGRKFRLSGAMLQPTWLRCSESGIATLHCYRRCFDHLRPCYE